MPGEADGQSSVKNLTAGNPGEAITVKGSHVMNIGFNRYAFALAVRPIAMDVFQGGNQIQQFTDPVSGISLTLEISRQNNQTAFDLKILYGCALIRPELACRLAG